jgi:AsmA protein
MTLTGGMRVQKFLDAPHYKGHVQISDFNPRRLLNKFGVSYDTADKRALRKAKFASNFNGSTNHVVFNKIRAALDNSIIKGSIEVAGFAQPAYKIDLDVSEIDLDRYLARPHATRNSAGGEQPKPLEVPLDKIRRLDMQGQTRIVRLKAFGIRSSDVSIQLSAKGGRVTFGPNKARLYGGRYTGKTIVDTTQRIPKFIISEELTNVQLGPFLKDANIYDKLSGTGDVSMNLTARGYQARAILQTLKGKGAISLRNGKIEGVNLQKSINDARVQYQMLRGKPVPVLPDASDETVFARFTGTITITNGVARNNDLSMRGANLRASGNGAANLSKETISYRLNVTLAETSSSKGVTVPVDISGTFSQPTYSVAWNEVLKAQVEKAIENKIEDRLKKKFKNIFKLKL